MGISTARETFEAVQSAQKRADDIIESGQFGHPQLAWADKMQTTLPLLATRRALASFFSGKVEQAIESEV